MLMLMSHCGSLVAYAYAYAYVASEDQALVNEYTDIFEGIGKLKDTSVHIHVDESITPVVQPHSRIPFNIHKQVEKELQKLEVGIIEDTDGPTPWVSPMVCVPKPRNPDEIRAASTPNSNH